MNFNLTPADQLEIRRQGIAKAFGIDIQKGDDKEGRWITTEDGNHAFIGGDGKPKYTREQIEGGSGSLGGVADEPSEDNKESLEDLKLQHIKLTNQALKTFPNSQKQLEVRKQRDEIGNKIKELESKDGKETKTESKDNDSFKDKYGLNMSSEQLAKLYGEKENGLNVSNAHLASNKGHEYENEKTFYGDLLDDLNKKGIKLDNKLKVQGAEVTSEPKKAPKISKTGLDSLQNIVKKDDEFTSMHGVLVDGDKLIATDAHRLVILKNNDPSLKDGSVISPKDKLPIGERAKKFPDYKRAIPIGQQTVDTDLDKISDIAAGAIESFKNIHADKSKAVNFKFGDMNIFVEPKLLLSTLQVLKANGGNKVKMGYSVPNRGISFETDNGNYGLVMPVMDGGGVNKTQPIEIK